MAGGPAASLTWVLQDPFTVMSAGIVSALYAVAKPELQSMLRTALSSVK